MSQQITVFSAADARYTPVTAVTWPLLRDWCRNKGYGYITGELPDGIQPPSWKKIPFLLQNCVPEHVNVWCDADVFIRDKNLDLAQYIPTDGIAFSADYNGLCAGFFIANGRWAMHFLELVWSLGPVPGDKFEQDTIKALYSTFHSVKRHVGFIHQNAISNPVNGTPRHQCSAFHAWAGDWKTEELAEKARKVYDSLLT